MQLKNLQLIVSIAVILAGVIVIPILVQCLPGGPWEPGTFQHTYFNIIWLVCSAAVFGLLCKFGGFRANLIGAVLLILFGPVTVLSIVFIGIYYKFIM